MQEPHRTRTGPLATDGSLWSAVVQPFLMIDRSVMDEATRRRRLRNIVEQSRQPQSDTGSCRVKLHFWLFCTDLQMEYCCH